MPTAELRYTAFAMRLNPGQTRVLHCDYGASLADRTFAAVIDDIDLEVTVDGTVVDIVFDGAVTEDLSTRTNHTWFLYDITSGDDPLQIEFGGPAYLSTNGTELPDDSVAVTSRDVTVNVTVLGEPGPPGDAGDGASEEYVDDAVAAEAAIRATADTALDGRVTDLEAQDVIVEGDSRLTDARTPTSHAASHQDGGSDELALDGSQITTGTVPDARIASTIARDSEVTAAITNHEAAADPHPGYLTAAEGNAAYDAAGAAAAVEADAVMDGDAAGGVLSGTFPNPGFAVDMATQAELNAEVTTRGDADAVIAAALAAETVSRDNADTAIAASLDAHIADVSDAHDASAVSFVPTGAVAATDVQAAIAELDTEKSSTSHDHSGTYQSLASSAVFANKYGNPGGVDDSAIVALALADLGSSGTLIFTPGTWALNLGSLGANTLTNGVRYRFEGFGPDETILQPVDATHALFTIQGPSDTSDDWFELSNLSLAMGADRAYTNPLIVLKGTKNFLFDNIRADVSTRTGKLIQLDSAYQGQFRNMDLRTGKWVLPIEIKNSYVPAAVGAAPQMDTIGFEQVVVTGSCGVVVRTATNEIHGLRFDGLKVVSTNYYAGSSNVETKLSAAVAIGDTALPVTDSTGIVANDVVTLDYEALAGHVEICKVSSVVGNTLNLTQPLEYAHDPVSRTKDIPVMVNGFVAMIGDGVHAVSTRGCMSEGQQVAWGLGGVQSFTTDGDYSGSGEWVRVYGATFKIRIGTTHLFGTQYANKVLFRPTYAISSNDSMWRIEGPFPVDTGATVTSPSYGDAHTSRTFQIRKTDNGLFYELWNTPTPGTAKLREIWNNGSSVAKEYWSGQIRRDDGVRGKYLSGTGKVAAADSDFVVTPDDGMTAVVRDSTSGITRLFLRSNGVWTQEIPPAADLLTAIKTVDGSGSGLDADTLDGHDTAYFEVAGAAAAAEAAAEAYAVQRANHTGTQLASTISDFSEAVDDRVGVLIADSTTLDATYDDGGNTESIDLKSTVAAPLRSSSGKAQNVPLWGTTTATPTAGVLYVVRITLEAKAYTTVTFGLATAGTSITNAYFALYDVSTLARLAVSADVSAAFMTTNGAKTAALSYTPGAAGDFYLGYVLGGGTPGAMVVQGIGNSVVLANVAPIICSRHNTTSLTAAPDPLVLMVTPSGFQLPWFRYE